MEYCCTREPKCENTVTTCHAGAWVKLRLHLLCLCNFCSLLPEVRRILLRRLQLLCIAVPYRIFIYRKWHSLYASFPKKVIRNINIRLTQFKVARVYLKNNRSLFVVVLHFTYYILQYTNDEHLI